MSRAGTTDELIIGGEPHVDLLPPEVKAGNKARSLRLRLRFVLIGALVLVVGGYVAASSYAVVAEAKLETSQTHTTDLLTEQAKYSEVRQVDNDIALVTGALEVGASTEIDWKSYLSEVRTVLPDDVAIDTVTVESAVPFQIYGQATVPLQKERVATLTIGVTTPNLPSVPAWLDAMKDLPGYADAAPSSITLTETGAFQVLLTLHINDGAYSNRFASETGE